MENTLNIQITLDDEQLKKLIMGNINDLPKEKLNDILLQSIKEILTSEDGKKLFISKSGYYSSSENRPSVWLQSLVEKSNITETISPVVNKAIADFSTNYPEILERCLKSSITGMFMDQFHKAQIDQMWDAMTKQD